MARRFIDLVRGLSTSVGVGPITLSAPVAGFTAFADAGLAPGDTFFYSLLGIDKPSEREVGLATWVGDGTITRAPSGPATDFTAGLKTLALVTAAEWFEEVEQNFVDVDNALGDKEPSIAAGAANQYWRGDKSWQVLDKAAVGLSNVDNTSDADKPVSTAMAAALAAKAALAQVPITVASRAALAALLVTNVAYLNEGGRSGIFHWTPGNHSTLVTADTRQAVAVAPAADVTGANGVWVRQRETEYLHVDWFGPNADGVTDDTPSFVALRTLGMFFSVASGAGVQQGPQIRLGFKTYYLASNYDCKGFSAAWIGQGGGLMASWGGIGGSRIKMAADASFIIQRADTEGAGVGLTIPFGADGSVFHDITFEGPGKGNGATPVVWLRAYGVHFYNPRFISSGSHGLAIIASAGGAGAAYGNANAWRVFGGSASGNTGSGIFTDGDDANAGRAIGVDYMYNDEHGVKDTSWIGNYFTGHWDGNLAGHVHSTGVGNGTIFQGYFEQGYPACTLSPNSSLIVEGGANPLTGDTRAVQYTQGGWPTFGGLRVQSYNAAMTSTMSIFIGGDPVNNNIETVELTGYDNVARRYVSGKNIFTGLGYGGADWDSIWTGAGNAAITFGADARYGDHGFKSLVVGDGTTNTGDWRRMRTGAAAPATGAHAVGERVFNNGNATAVTVTESWLCTVAGTPGTWVALPPAGAGGGLSDGDKGDVVVGGGGTTLTVESATPADGTFEVTGSLGVSVGASIAGNLTALGNNHYLGPNSGVQDVTVFVQSNSTLAIVDWRVQGFYQGSITGSGNNLYLYGQNTIQAGAGGSGYIFNLGPAGLAITGTLSATGAVSGSNLSGTNTGDEPLFGAAIDGIVPASGGGAVNFLRADGNWAVPAAGAAGATPQLQFNNGGALDAATAAEIDASGSLRLLHVAAPTTPGNDKLAAAVQRVSGGGGGRAFMRWRSEDAVNITVATHQGRNTIASAQALGNATTALSYVGMTALTAIGTATARNVATTNRLTRAKRLAYLSAATTGAAAGLHNITSNTQYTVGGAAGGGFMFISRFAVSDAALVAGAHMILGVRNATATPGVAVNPNTLTNIIALAQTNGSANYHIVYGGSAAQAPIDTGIAVNNTDLYEFVLSARPDDATRVAWRLENITTGASASGVLTAAAAGTQLPATATLLGPILWRSNNATAAAVGIDIVNLYIESDFA